MKYSELEKLLTKHGCYWVKDASHPIWFSPTTEKYFRMSHHKSEEVKKGTLGSILKDAGVK